MVSNIYIDGYILFFLESAYVGVGQEFLLLLFNVEYCLLCLLWLDERTTSVTRVINIFLRDFLGLFDRFVVVARLWVAFYSLICEGWLELD